MKRLVLLLAALSACNSDQSGPHLARGNVLANNGKKEEAAAEYREAAKTARTSLAQERLGDVLYDLGRKDEALQAYQAASASDPGSVTARIGAARVFQDKGELEKARAELSAGLLKAPSNLYLLLSRGNLALKAGDRKAALADYAQAVHLKSDNVPALYQYGVALLEDGQAAEAAATFDRLIEKSPAAPQGYYGRALVFAKRGEGAFAAEALAEAQKRVEQDARARLVEQGLKDAALDTAAHDAAERSLASMRADPAFAKWATDAGFRRTAGWAP